MKEEGGGGGGGGINICMDDQEFDADLDYFNCMFLSRHVRITE